jgi:chromosome segregation ATPase
MDPREIELEAFRAETEELRRDLAERQERRALGLEPVQWRLPEPETRAPVAVDTLTKQEAASIAAAAVGKLRQQLRAEFADVMTAFATEAGRAVGQVEKKVEKLHARVGGADIGDLRASIEGLRQAHAQMEGLIAKEAKARTEGAQAQIADLLKAKAAREDHIIATDRKLLEIEGQIMDLRRLMEAR